MRLEVPSSNLGVPTDEKSACLKWGRRSADRRPVEGNAAEPLFDPVPEPIDEAPASGVQTEGWYEVDAAAPSSSAMRRTSIAVAITALVVALLAVAGCGGDEASVVETVTVIETVDSLETIPTTSGSSAAASPDSAAGSCEDVTSFDYDWDNDMLCTRPDGSTFYTDYAGAERFETYGDE